MAPIITPFSQIRGSLPPLIPKPEPTVAAPPVESMPASLPPFPSANTPKVSLAAFDPATATPQELAEQPLTSALRSDETKDLNPWGTAQNHPGFLGKLGHALSVATGGPQRRQYEEMGLQKSLQDLINSESRNELEGAQSGLAGATEKHTEAETPEVAPNAESTRALQGAQTQEAGARTHALENPLATTPEMDTYRKLTGMGMSPAEALQEIEKDKQLALAPKNMTAKTLQLPNGQQVAGKTDSQGNLLLEDGTPAPKGSKLYQPPNYGQLILPTKTEKKLGPDNVQHLYGYDERTQQYDIDQGAAPTGQAAHQIFQGGAIEALAPQIISDINANREILGNLPSYYKQWTVGTPVSDPRAAQLMTELMSFAAMQPALHAFRSSNAMEAFEKMVGGLSKNPDATIATINGLLKTPEAFTNMPKGNGGKPSQQGNTEGSQKFQATSSDGKWGWNGKAWVSTGKGK